MENLIGMIQKVQGMIPEILSIIAYLIAIASVIVKLTPTLKDDNFLLPIIKFVGKYIALDKYGVKEINRPE